MATTSRPQTRLSGTSGGFNWPTPWVEPLNDMVYEVHRSSSVFGTNTISLTMPPYVQENDLIVLGLMRSDAITSGLDDYTMRVDQVNDGTSTFIRYATVYTRKASSFIPENLTIVQGPITTRLGGVLVILRPKPGYEVTLENSAVGTYYTGATTPGLHPIPTVTALGDGRMAFVLSVCAYAATSGNTSYSVATPYWQATTASLAQNRLCAAVLPLNNGESTVDVVSSCSHDNTALHDGAEIAIIFTATAL